MAAQLTCHWKKIDFDPVTTHSDAGQEDEINKIKQVETQDEITDVSPTTLVVDLLIQRSVKRSYSETELDEDVKRQKNWNTFSKGSMRY